MRLLETHPCQGGATAGYMRAGWDVTAVDIAKRHRKYNPARVFFVADAETYIRQHGHEYDAIHVSPPCQWYTRGNAKDRAAGNSKWARSIPPIREALLSTGRPYVLENVADAAWDMRDPVGLCGCMFSLSTVDSDGIRIHLQRLRLFETNWGLTAPAVCEGEGRPRREHPSHEWVAGAYGGARRNKYEARYIRKGGYVPADKAVVKRLLGVEHEMTWNGLFECLPPAYTQHIGEQLLAHLDPPHPRPVLRRESGARDMSEQAWHVHHNDVVCREDKCRMRREVTDLFPVKPCQPPPCGDPYPHSHPFDCKASPAPVVARPAPQTEGERDDETD